MSMMVSFVLSFFPRDVLDEILNLIESVSEDFPSYSLTIPKYKGGNKPKTNPDSIQIATELYHFFQQCINCSKRSFMITFLMN